MMTTPPKLEDLLAVDLADIDKFVVNLVAKNPNLQKDKPDPVRWVMVETIANFHGGLNPIYLRPLVTARIYGIGAIAHILKLASYQLDSLLPFVENDANFVAAIEKAKEALKLIGE